MLYLNLNSRLFNHWVRGRIVRIRFRRNCASGTEQLVHNHMNLPSCPTIMILQIKRLDLNHNSITDEGIRHLLPIVRKLSKLYINNNPITAVGYKLLYDAIRHIWEVSVLFEKNRMISKKVSFYFHLEGGNVFSILWSLIIVTDYCLCHRLTNVHF